MSVVGIPDADSAGKCKITAQNIYSLFASYKAHDIDIRNWLEDTLKRIPTEKDITMLLPENWQQVTAK